MKLRRPRLKRVAGWASVAAGAMLMLVATLAHLDGWGARWSNALSYGESGFELGRSDLSLTFTTTSGSMPPDTGMSAPGVYVSIMKTPAGESILFSIDQLRWPFDRRLIACAASHHTLGVISFKHSAYILELHAAWLWAAAAPMLFTPVFLRVWSRRRRRKGACTKCGYDLAGLPEGEPCPECGV